MSNALTVLTASTSYRRARATDSTDSSYPARAPTLTEPAADGAHDLANGGKMVQNTLMIVPYGTDAAARTFAMRVLNWRRVTVAGVFTWFPVPIGDFTCTLSTFAGVTGGTPDASHLVCDTVSLTAGFATAGLTCEVVSPGGNVPAHVMLTVKGAEKVEFLFDLGTAAAANALYALL